MFEEAFRQHRKFVGNCMVLWLRSGEGAALRLGAVASRKTGNAVERARCRRRLREVFRRHGRDLRGAFDLVLVARRSLLRAPWDQVVREFLRLTRQAGLQERVPPPAPSKGVD